MEARGARGCAGRAGGTAEGTTPAEFARDINKAPMVLKDRTNDDQIEVKILLKFGIGTHGDFKVT